MSLAQSANGRDNGNIRCSNKQKNLRVTFPCNNYTVVKQKMKDLTPEVKVSVTTKPAYCLTSMNLSN